MSKTVRAAAVAKHIGVTSLQLRKMLETVNMGVKPSDREFPITIVPGIVRFASRKLRKEIPPFELDEDDMAEDDEDEIEVPKRENEDGEEKPVIEKKVVPAAFAALNQMGKRKVEIKKAPERKPIVKRPAGPAIFRKIEVDPAAAAAARKEREEQQRKSKEDREREQREQHAMQRRKKHQQELVKKEGVVEIPAAIPIKEFSEKVGIPSAQIITVLMKNGMMATLTQSIDFDTYALIAEELEIEIKKEEAHASAEEVKAGDLKQILADDQENLVARPAVVVVMGHVDHGKTSILDVIRKTKVAEGESGGITQHIGAYKVTKNGKEIAFLDTPGHAAFTAMRARGAKVADIAILVVAADEGMKPQTIEAINHAKAAEMPVIVAINKMDKPGATPDKVKGELGEHGLTPDDWGGETTCVPVSALKKEGIDDLLEIIALQTEMMDLKANPNRKAVATVIESNLDASLGPVATVLVNGGTLRVGDNFVLAHQAGKVRMMTNEDGKKLKEAGPSTPVQLTGLGSVPSTGDILQVFGSAKEAKNSAEELAGLIDDEKRQQGGGLMDIMASLKSGDMRYLTIVLKADTQGTLEAIKQAIDKIETIDVAPKIIHAATGAVSESDIMMASASKGIVVSFHSLVSPRAKRIADQEKVEVKSYKIIYELLEDIEGILEGMLEAQDVEVPLGTAVAKQIFFTKKKMMIVGCGLTEGSIEKGALVKIMRGEEEVGKGKIELLQHFEKQVEVLEAPTDCGIQFAGKISINEGDILKISKIEKRFRKKEDMILKPIMTEKKEVEEEAEEEGEEKEGEEKEKEAAE